MTIVFEACEGPCIVLQGQVRDAHRVSARGCRSQRAASMGNPSQVQDEIIRGNVHCRGLADSKAAETRKYKVVVYDSTDQTSRAKVRQTLQVANT